MKKLKYLIFLLKGERMILSNKPYKGENGNQFAERLMDERSGKGNYSKKTNTEFSKIKKWRIEVLNK